MTRRTEGSFLEAMTAFCAIRAWMAEKVGVTLRRARCFGGVKGLSAATPPSMVTTAPVM